jgi:signal transduction histidine kinase
MAAHHVDVRHPRTGLGHRGRTLLAHPRSGGRRREYAATFLACLTVLALVLFGEDSLPNNPTLQGFALLSILVATWRLPARLSVFIVALAAVLPFVSVYFGVLDTLTARFQLISTVVTACLAEFTVRAILQADRERSSLLAVLVRFTADAAHELRSPITAIQTVAEVALAQPRDQHEYRRSLETVLRSSHQLIRLTDALLLLASEDAGALTVGGNPVDVSDLVEEALDRWRKRAVDRGVRLDGPSVPPHGQVSGDEVLLGRLLDNLLENAVRHAGPEGGVSLDIGGGQADGWTILVTDTGPGFDESFRARAFERFTRAEKHRSRDGGGAGLGLPLCAAIASAHGGSVTIDASVTGAQLRVWLPATTVSGGGQPQRRG